MDKTYNMKVGSVTKITTDKEDGEEVLYKLSAKDDAGHAVSLSSKEAFEGIAPGSSLMFVVRNSQRSIKEFKEGDGGEE